MVARDRGVFWDCMSTWRRSALTWNGQKMRRGGDRTMNHICRGRTLTMRESRERIGPFSLISFCSFVRSC